MKKIVLFFLALFICPVFASDLNADANASNDTNYSYHSIVDYSKTISDNENNWLNQYYEFELTTGKIVKFSNLMLVLGGLVALFFYMKRRN